MINVVVATCFVVFIGLGNTSLLYYAAKGTRISSINAKHLRSQLSASVGDRGGEPQ
jgi:hypothetical protein